MDETQVMMAKVSEGVERDRTPFEVGEERVSKALESLAYGIEQLRGRLDPVLRMADAAPGEALTGDRVVEPSGSSRVLSHMGYVEDRLGGLERTVMGLLNRLEV